MRDHSGHVGRVPEPVHYQRGSAVTPAHRPTKEPIGWESRLHESINWDIGRGDHVGPSFHEFEEVDDVVVGGLAELIVRVDHRHIIVRHLNVFPREGVVGEEPASPPVLGDNQSLSVRA